MTEEARLTEGPVLTGMLRFGAPLALAMAFHGLFNCVDLLIVGRLGPGAVAAVTMGGIINMVAMLAFNGIANVVAARCAQAAGQSDTTRLGSLVADGRTVTVMASVVLGFMFAGFAHPLTDAFGTTQQTQSEGIVYLVILSLGSGTMFFLLFQSACLRAVGDSRRPMIALIGANVLNLLLDVLLVFGLWGFPQLGVAGAAWATVLSRLLGAFYLGRILKQRQKKWLPVFPRISRVFSIVKEGLTHSAQMVVRVISIYALMVIATIPIGKDDMGGWAATMMLDGVGVAIRLEMVILFCALGWGTAAASYLGQNFGARRFDRAAYGMGAAILGAFSSCFLLAAGLYLWPVELLEFVAPKTDGLALEEGQRYLQIVLFGHPGLIVAVVVSQALVGIGSVRTAVLVDSALYLLLAIPIANAAIEGGSENTPVWTVLMWLHLVSAPTYLLVFRKRFLQEKQKVEATTAVAP